MATPVVACGFECGVLPSAGHHLQSGIGSPSFDTTTFRSGLRALRCDATAALVSGTLVFTGSTVAVGRVYIRFASLPSADCILADWDSSTNANIWFKASDSKLYARIGTTAGASGIAVTTGQWYRLDFKWDDTNNTSDLQVDGVAAGQARAAFSVAVPGRIPFGLLTSVTADIYFDDWLVSTTAVDYPLGAGYVLSYIPNADGTHNVDGANDFEKTLTGTDITNATTDAWQLIDERPLPTTAVDFINGIGPPNSTDYVEWQYEDSTEANAPRAVEGLIVYHDASGAGTNNFSVTLREHAGGTSADIMAPATRNVGATITYARAQFATVPGTSDAWTTVKFNALRSRFLVSDASPDPYIDAAMLEAEFPSGVEGIFRTVTDALTAADSAVRAFVGARPTTDSLTASDSPGRVGQFLRSVADGLGLSDTAAQFKTLLRTVTDSLGLTDAPTRALTLLRSVADTLTAGDVSARTLGLLRSVADAIGLSDAAIASKTFLRSVSESLGLSDAATRTGSFLRTVSDSLTAGDVVARAGSFLRTVADAIALADAAIAEKTGNVIRTATDALGLSDVATRTGSFLRTVTDALTVGDAATRAVALTRAVTDALGLSDAAARLVALLPTP